MEKPMGSVRLSFSKLQANHQIAWDSTSLGALKTCPRYYQYNILEGYVTKADNAHLKWGSAYNNALVTYNQSKANGMDHEQAMLEAVRYALTTTWDYVLDRPWASDEPVKTRVTLVRSVIWYLTQFEEDPCETDILATGEPAVELSFRIDIDLPSELTGENYMLCGYLDRKVNFNGSEWITDWKSTKYALDEKYFSGYSPNNQVSQYSFAGRIITQSAVRGVIIDAVQLGVTFARFARAEISRTDAQLEEWFRDAVYYIRENEKFVRENYWPQNDTSCTKYGGCPYKKVCGATPDIRPRLLEGLFHRRLWDPLVVREI
jgi:hypothetical protein